MYVRHTTVNGLVARFRCTPRIQAKSCDSVTCHLACDSKRVMKQLTKICLHWYMLFCNLWFVCNWQYWYMYFLVYCKETGRFELSTPLGWFLVLCEYWDGTVTIANTTHRTVSKVVLHLSEASFESVFLRHVVQEAWRAGGTPWGTSGCGCGGSWRRS